MTADRPCRWCPSPLVEGAESLCLDCMAKESMLKEGLTTAPEHLGREDFDRFLWKLAVYAIKGMEPSSGKLRWTLEHVRNSLALPIIEALPMNYISVLKTEPHRPGEPAPEVIFTLKTQVPRTLLFKTVEKLGIWKPIKKDKEEPDDFTGV